MEYEKMQELAAILKNIKLPGDWIDFGNTTGETKKDEMQTPKNPEVENTATENEE